MAYSTGFSEYLRSIRNGLLSGESFMTAAYGSKNEQNGRCIGLFDRRPDDFIGFGGSPAADIQIA